MKRTAFALAAFGALFAAQPAFAESIGVKYSDLDLGTKAGQQELSLRIGTAAKKVCGLNDISTGTRVQNPEARSCVAEVRQKLETRLAALTDKRVAGR